jgi:hypothetical protein
MSRFVDENTSPEESERLFRRARNARRGQQQQESRPPEPKPVSNSIVELAEIAAELLRALEIIGQDMPRVQAILTPLSSRIAELRWG